MWRNVLEWTVSPPTPFYWMAVATFMVLAPFSTLFFLPLLGIQTAGIVGSLGATIFLIIGIGKGIYTNLEDIVQSHCEEGAPCVTQSTASSPSLPPFSLSIAFLF